MARRCGWPNGFGTPREIAGRAGLLVGLALGSTWALGTPGLVGDVFADRVVMMKFAEAQIPRTREHDGKTGDGGLGADRALERPGWM